MSTKMPQPEVQTIKLHKNSNGMGLSIVAAKGAGQVSVRPFELDKQQILIIFLTLRFFRIVSAFT